MLFKFFWFIRALFYKPFFGNFGLPSYIGRPLYLSGSKSVYIGKRVRIFPGIRLECISSNGSIFIGDNVSIGQRCHITAASRLVIGKDTAILFDVMITNIDHEYQQIGVPVASQPLIVKETRIGENCFIGSGAKIQAGTILGRQCIVGTNAVVRGVFPDYSVIVGVPAKIVKRYNPKTEHWESTNAKGEFLSEL